MTTVYDVPADKLVKLAAEKLKKNKAIYPPRYSFYAKKGVNTELPPMNPDWWWIRCSSILRQLYIKGPLGVARLRTYYGGRQRRGVKPERFRKGSGKIIRDALMQLERAGYVSKTKRGRKLSPKGQSFLDSVAHEIKIKEIKKEGEKKEE
ncbi:MAG: 30S ribosomal protein S19e [Candidatus Methanospirareceae archaeon]